MLKKISIGVVNVYQAFCRPLLPSSCRFYPSCSEYAKEAIEKFGFLRGVLKTAVRLLHCHPLSGKSGYDPVK